MSDAPDLDDLRTLQERLDYARERLEAAETFIDELDHLATPGPIDGLLEAARLNLARALEIVEQEIVRLS